MSRKKDKKITNKKGIWYRYNNVNSGWVLYFNDHCFSERSLCFFLNFNEKEWEEIISNKDICCINKGCIYFYELHYIKSLVLMSELT